MSRGDKIVIGEKNRVLLTHTRGEEGFLDPPKTPKRPLPRGGRGEPARSWWWKRQNREKERRGGRSLSQPTKGKSASKHPSLRTKGEGKGKTDLSRLQPPPHRKRKGEGGRRLLRVGESIGFSFPREGGIRYLRKADSLVHCCTKKKRKKGGDETALTPPKKQA